jgi:hypothetical protein
MGRRLRSTERRCRAALVLGVAGLIAGLLLASVRPGIGQDQALGVLRSPLDVRNAGGKTIFYVGEDKDVPLIRLNEPTGKQAA